MKKFNEFVSLSERPLTKGEEDKKEDIVKGMKKDKKGFEDRYGDDAKSVMYATATKLAKEETETVGGVTVLQDYDSTIQFREYEVIDIIKPEPMKGMASEQKELEPTVDQEPSKDNEQIKKKEKKVNMMKRQILMKKMQAVRSGAGGDIVAHNELEGDMIDEGLVSMVKKGAKRHAKAVEKKKIKDRKAVPYAALGASYEPEGEVIDEKKKGLDGKACWKGYKLVGTKKKGGKTVDDCVKVKEEVGCESKKIENKGKKKIDPNKNPVVEAKVDKGRSDYGKASIRNYRRSGPGHGEPAMFDPDNKRGKLIDKRREEHKARRGVKKAKVPAYKLGEEGYDRMRDDRLVKYGIGHDGSDRKGSTRYHSRPDTPEQKKRKQAASDEAYKSVVAKLKKKYGDGVMTSSKKIRKGKEVK